jgi:hypothetical protein
MPIGGSAYYDKFRKNLGAKKPAVQAQAPAPAPVQPTLPAKEKSFAKSIAPVERGARPMKKLKNGSSGSTGRTNDPSSLDDVVSQILDLAQRVHAVAGQAEAAVLRAEAAVLKAEVVVGKAEAAASRADSAFSKCDVAVSRAESAAFKSETSAKRAEISASKAGLAVGKSELGSVSRDASSIMADASNIAAAGFAANEEAAEPAGEEDNRTKELESPISQIAVMSMKLRSGMRQIEEAREQGVERSAFLRPGANINITVGREDLATGLVSLDNETALPRVAPFIMDESGQAAGESAAKPEGGGESSSKPAYNDVSSAA